MGPDWWEASSPSFLLSAHEHLCSRAPPRPHHSQPPQRSVSEPDTSAVAAAAKPKQAKKGSGSAGPPGADLLQHPDAGVRFVAEQLTQAGGHMKMAHLGGVLNRERRDMKAVIGRVRGFVVGLSFSRSGDGSRLRAD